MLALVVSALYRFMRDIGEENIVQKRIQRERERVLEHTVANSTDLRHRENETHNRLHKRTIGLPRISPPSEPRPFRTAMGKTVRSMSIISMPKPLRTNQKAKVLLLKEEKDRFEAMRAIQADTKKYKQWMALLWSITLFSILWCIGAIVFWQTEKDTQDMTYFQALYFCYISLLTVGYGDLSPKSNAGRCFFVVWSLVAIPTMTILVSDLGDTVVAKFKQVVDGVADFTVLPKESIWRPFLDKHPFLPSNLRQWIDDKALKKRVKNGFQTMDPMVEIPIRLPSPHNSPSSSDDDDDNPRNTISALAAEAEADQTRPPTPTSLSRHLAQSIKRIAHDLRLPHPKRYSYEEWVEFTRLIRLTTPQRLDCELGTHTIDHATPHEEGLVNWDWIGANSPLMSGLTESEWLLESLCESLIRLQRRKEVAADRRDLAAMREMSTLR